MTITELFEKIRIDGEPVGHVLQAQIDHEQVTIVYEKPREGAEPALRTVTVESEAVTIG